MLCLGVASFILKSVRPVWVARTFTQLVRCILRVQMNQFGPTCSVIFIKRKRHGVLGNFDFFLNSEIKERK